LAGFCTTFPFKWNPVPQHGFLGLKFKIGSDTHYGWAEITVLNDFNITLHGFGYESVHDVRIEIPNTTTLVELTSFTANEEKNSVKIEWSTGAEVENAGFNLWRAEGSSGGFEKINGALIPAQGSTTAGASYVFSDTGVAEGKAYRYKLEDIEINGKSTFHAPVSVIMGTGIIEEAPSSGTICQAGHPLEFSWKSQGIKQSWIEFSGRSDFGGSRLLFPTHTRGTEAPSVLTCTPSAQQWQKAIRRMERAGKRGYWRVVGKGYDGLTYVSEAGRLSVQ